MPSLTTLTPYYNEDVVSSATGARMHSNVVTYLRVRSFVAIRASGCHTFAILHVFSLAPDNCIVFPTCMVVPVSMPFTVDISTIFFLFMRDFSLACTENYPRLPLSVRLGTKGTVDGEPSRGDSGRCDRARVPQVNTPTSSR